MQDKQSLLAVKRQLCTVTVLRLQWFKVQAEIDKCQLDQFSRRTRPLFLFCTDELVVDAPSHMPERVVIIDRAQHEAFFGSVLANRKAMCLAEVSASAK